MQASGLRGSWLGAGLLMPASPLPAFLTIETFRTRTAPQGNGCPEVSQPFSNTNLLIFSHLCSSNKYAPHHVSMDSFKPKSFKVEMARFLKTKMIRLCFMLFPSTLDHPKYIIVAISTPITWGTQCSNVKLPAEFRLRSKNVLIPK